MTMHLRDVTPADRRLLRQWRNQPDVAAHMYTDHYITEAEHNRWFDQALENPNRRYWIFNLAGQDIGLGCFYDIHWSSRRFHTAFYLAAGALRGRGAGALAEYGLVLKAFDELKLNKGSCEVLEGNRAVIKGHETFGFVQEGYLRQHVFKNGRPMNVVLMSLLREDWEARRAEVTARIRRIEERSARMLTV